MMCDYAFFAKDPSQREEAYQVLWGSQHLPPFGTIPGYPGTSFRALNSLPC